MYSENQVGYLCRLRTICKVIESLLVGVVMLSRETLQRELDGGYFLSALMGTTDGSYCASRAKGCRMVQLGAYLAEPDAPASLRQESPGAFLPEDPWSWVRFFEMECAEASRQSGALTCLNLAALKLEWAVHAANCFIEAGGDAVELNVHGGYSRYLEHGKLRAMVLPDNRKTLLSWVEVLRDHGVPLILKFCASYEREHLLRVLDSLEGQELVGIHLNVRDPNTKRPDIAFVKHVSEEFSQFLLISGYVRSKRDAEHLWNAGAKMVGIGEPTLREPDFIYRLSH